MTLAATSVPPTTAPAAPQTAGSGRATGKVGERVDAGGVALIISDVRAGPTAGPEPAPSGMIWVIIGVTIENTGRDAQSSPAAPFAPYNPYNFRLKAADGTEYEHRQIMTPQALKSGKLQKGEIVKGDVGFQVPTAAKGLVITYDPGALLGGRGVISIDLGR